MMHFSRRGLCAVLLAFAGCQWNDDTNAGSLTHNVGEAFADCNESELRFLAGKHNVQLVFRPCANNAFSAYRWAPDGTHIYFQLVMSGYIMNANAANKATASVPVPTPIGPAEWLNATTVAVPVVGAKPGASNRMAVYKRPGEASEPGAIDAGQLMFHPLPGIALINEMHQGDSPIDLLFVGHPTNDLASEATLYKMDTAAGTFAPAFEWLDDPFTTFTYNPANHIAVFGHEGQVWTVNALTGEEIGRWDNATRGALHSDGRWLMLEFEGPAVSVYFQRTWDELSTNARKRELARAERFAEGLPEWAPRTLHPPSLSVVDLQNNGRWAFTAFQGNRFQWYEAAGTFGSFFLWGFEGKQLKRNVALSNFADRLNAIVQGKEMMGVLPFDEFIKAGGIPKELPEQ